MQQQLDKH